MFTLVNYVIIQSVRSIVPWNVFDEHTRFFDIDSFNAHIYVEGKLIDTDTQWRRKDSL